MPRRKKRAKFVEGYGAAGDPRDKAEKRANQEEQANHEEPQQTSQEEQASQEEPQHGQPEERKQVLDGGVEESKTEERSKLLPRPPPIVLGPAFWGVPDEERDALVEGGVKALGRTSPQMDLLLYGSSPEFIALRVQFEVEVRELRLKATPELFEERMAELTRRHLDVAAVDLALQRRRITAEGHARDVAVELHMPPEQVATELHQRRIHDCVLQLFKVLTRRRLSVLRGEPLPRLDSVFAKVKLE